MRISVHPLFLFIQYAVLLEHLQFVCWLLPNISIKSGKCEIKAILSTNYVKI